MGGLSAVASRPAAALREGWLAKADDSGSRGQRPPLQLGRQYSRERHFAVDGLLNNIFYSGADF